MRWSGSYAAERLEKTIVELYVGIVPFFYEGWQRESREGTHTFLLPFVLPPQLPVVAKLFVVAMLV